MSEDKISSDEVPQKFAEWLLAMGCPQENVPPVDKVTEMCRGQYYMVWRSLMERVEPKDIIRNKRLQVFCDDMKKCQKKSIFNERDTNAELPEELSLWNQQTQLKEKVSDAEVRVAKEKETMHQLMDKVSSKLSHRAMSTKRLQDAQRRTWLLRQLAEELSEKRANLQETKIIADSLCGLEEGVDIESKLDKCVTALARHASNGKAAGFNPAACSSIASTGSNSDNNEEDVISSLVKCRGDVLFNQLYEKRAALCADIPGSQEHDVGEQNRVSPQAVLSHTAALHCNLALETMKNRVHIKHARSRLVDTVNEFNNYLTGEACELLVLRCEKARGEARLATMRALCEELSVRSGIFATGADQVQDGGAAKHIHIADRAIESKRDELKRLIATVAVIEKKTQKVKECLLSLFNSFHEGERDSSRFGGRSSLPQETVSTLRQFYEEKREKRKNHLQLSMDFDVSDNCSFSDPDNGSPNFVDELKLYLKKFSLEKNRKIVLESGEKIWAFETLNSSLQKLHSSWQNEDITTALLCPSVSLKYNLRTLAERTAGKLELENVLRVLENHGKKTDTSIDITSITAEEQNILDRIKKRLNENIISLQKTNKTLDVGLENLQIWSENEMKKYISDNRSVDGKGYKHYENVYVESLQIT